MLFVFQIELDRSYLLRFNLSGKGVDEGVLKIDDNGYVSVLRKVDYENSDDSKMLKVSTP